MSKKQIKKENKHTVKEVLKSIEWSIEGDNLVLLSTITDEYITINLEAIEHGKTK